MNRGTHPNQCVTIVSARNGTVLIAALVALVVVMAMIGAMLKGTLRVRRQLHAERDLRQCELLLQAGMQRAAHRLSREPDYRQETWRLPAESIVGSGEGEVTIQASRESDDDPWQVEVVAEYPLHNDNSVRRSRTFRITPQPPQSSEN